MKHARQSPQRTPSGYATGLVIASETCVAIRDTGLWDKYGVPNSAKHVKLPGSGSGR